MPTCFITVSGELTQLDDFTLTEVRRIVAEGLDSRARRLDKDHVVVRVLTGSRQHMLGDIEVEVFAQLYLQRLFSRDRRAQFISAHVSRLLGVGCATWINLSVVGYSRVTARGEVFFSD